eukprot:284817425_4
MRKASKHLFTHKKKGCVCMCNFMASVHLESRALHPMWDEFLRRYPENTPVSSTDANENFFYFNRTTGQLSLQFPDAVPNCLGGILADEMGLGKTVQTIALISLDLTPTAAELEGFQEWLEIVSFQLSCGKIRRKSMKVYAEQSASDWPDSNCSSFPGVPHLTPKEHVRDQAAYFFGSGPQPSKGLQNAGGIASGSSALLNVPMALTHDASRTRVGLCVDDFGTAAYQDSCHHLLRKRSHPRPSLIDTSCGADNLRHHCVGCVRVVKTSDFGTLLHLQHLLLSSCGGEFWMKRISSLMRRHVKRSVPTPASAGAQELQYKILKIYSPIFSSCVLSHGAFGSVYSGGETDSGLVESHGCGIAEASGFRPNCQHHSSCNCPNSASTYGYERQQRSADCRATREKRAYLPPPVGEDTRRFILSTAESRAILSSIRQSIDRVWRIGSIGQRPKELHTRFGAAATAAASCVLSATGIFRVRFVNAWLNPGDRSSTKVMQSIGTTSSWAAKFRNSSLENGSLSGAYVDTQLQGIKNEEPLAECPFCLEIPASCVMSRSTALETIQFSQLAAMCFVGLALQLDPRQRSLCRRNQSIPADRWDFPAPYAGLYSQSQPLPRCQVPPKSQKKFIACLTRQGSFATRRNENLVMRPMRYGFAAIPRFSRRTSTSAQAKRNAVVFSQWTT